METTSVSELERACQKAIIRNLSILTHIPEASLSIARALNTERGDYLRLRQRVIREAQQETMLIIAAEDFPGKPTHRVTEAFKDQYANISIVELTIPSNHNDLTRWALEKIGNNPADCLILQGVSMPLVIIGMLYKLIWGAAVLVEDRSDGEAGYEVGISINELKTRLGCLPAIDNLTGELWRRIAINCSERFDGSSEKLEQENWRTIALGPRLAVDGAQLNSLEALSPEISSPLMAARFCEKNDSAINWEALKLMDRGQKCVSIVIPVYGDARETDSCIRSVRKAVNKLPWEIIAVMNDESAASCSVINRHRKEDKRIRAIWPGENLQFALGCNLGFSVSSGKWLVVLNNDCQVKSGWLDELIAPLENPRIAATQPRLLKLDGSVQSLGVVFNHSQTLGYPLYAGQPSTLLCTQKDHFLQALTGACMAVRAEDFASIRGFDCRYINSQEDIDLCLRLLRLPQRAACLSMGGIDVLHGESRAPGRFSHSRWSRHQFVRRWAYRIESDDAQIYSADSVIINGFSPDHPDLEQAGIGAGRARIQSSQSPPFEGKS